MTNFALDTLGTNVHKIIKEFSTLLAGANLDLNNLPAE